MSWKFWGSLESGGNVYCTEEGHIAIEKDYRNLVEPTPMERQEIYRTWPGLCDKPKKYQVPRKEIDKLMIKGLRDAINELSLGGTEREKVIEALKTANAEKDTLIAGLIDDATQREREIDGLTMALRERGQEKLKAEKKARYDRMIGRELEYSF